MIFRPRVIAVVPWLDNELRSVAGTAYRAASNVNDHPAGTVHSNAWFKSTLAQLARKLKGFHRRRLVRCRSGPQQRTRSVDRCGSVPCLSSAAGDYIRRKYRHINDLGVS